MHPAVRRCRRRGLSIIEVLIALTMLSVGVLALAGSLAGTSSWRRLSSSRLALVDLTEGKLEELRMIALDPSRVDTMQLTPGGSLTSSQLHHADTVVSTSGVTVVRRWTVVSAPASMRDLVVAAAPMTARAWHVNSIRLATRVAR
jgi:prepilin-type N-terminal cleavage/methylation domain-containing protein